MGTLVTHPPYLQRDDAGDVRVVAEVDDAAPLWFSVPSEHEALRSSPSVMPLTGNGVFVLAFKAPFAERSTAGRTCCAAHAIEPARRGDPRRPPQR